ncbi:unnamed protein product, partial [Mesorhabditis belari]|uniref:Uncharacterized protein n=1 Tax=Mesorhabditis belari TaxID=2138241 RepID=A0AAF3EF45_9BILA
MQYRYQILVIIVKLWPLHLHIRRFGVQIGGEEDFEDEDTSQAAPFTITYTPLDSQSICSSEPHPLDNLHSCSTASLIENSLLSQQPLTPWCFHRSAPPEIHMSPARAKFLADHREDSLFKEEIESKPEKEKKSSGWWKGMANSPLMKMIKSQTTDHLDKRSSASDGSGGSESGAAGTLGGFVASPSLHNIVSQVKRGYDEVVREGGVSSKLRLGMSSIYQEVKGIQRSTGLLGSGQIFGGEADDPQTVQINQENSVFQLDSGSADTLLHEKFWTDGLFEKDEETPSTSKILDVTMCVATPCPHCHLMIYDEDIMAGWKVEDQNMNTECPYCQIVSTGTKEQPGCFAPMLHINFQWKNNCRVSWYQPHLKGSADTNEASNDQELPPALTVAFISPIVLRRELETLVAQDMLSFKNKSLMESHPIVFWNLVYFLRRLALPSHLFSWIGSNVHIRCVYDRPTFHPSAPPLYISNQAYSNLTLLNSHTSRESSRKQVTTSVGESNMFKAIQALVNESRTVDDGNVVLSAHFPIFRDIQFASIDEYGRALNRCNLDDAYQTEFDRLPPRIKPLLPIQDNPSPLLNRACKMIFVPLDLF